MPNLIFFFMQLAPFTIKQWHAYELNTNYTQNKC